MWWRMMYFCRPAQKLASPWFPSTKSQMDSWIRFWIITKNKLKYMICTHFLFSKIFVTDEHRFCDFWGINEIVGSKKLMLGYKWTTLQKLRDLNLNVTTTGHFTTQILYTVIINLSILKLIRTLITYCSLHKTNCEKGSVFTKLWMKKHWYINRCIL